MDQWINAMPTKKQRRLATDCTENMQQLQDGATQEFILKIKFDKDQTNNSKDIKRILIELIQKLDKYIIFLQQPLSILFLHHLGGDHPTAGGQHGIGTLHHGMSIRSFLVPEVSIFAYRKYRFPCKRQAVYTDHLVARIFLMRTVCQVVLSGSHRDCHSSCLAQVQDEALCVFQNSSHHHVVRYP